jgi:diaminopimelate epimerase
MAAALAFRKYQGLGNDFLVIDAVDENSVPAERAAALCNRRFGVGADGVLLVLAPRTAGNDATMRVINADGSVPEMCGNGVRCVALDIARARGLQNAALRIDTDAGVRTCGIEDAEGAPRITVDMGVVRVLGERVFRMANESITARLADAGNPHAVLFGTFDSADVQRLGPLLATHPDFARGTNVEFARVASDGIDLVVWERGVGVTLACGTGACATVAVACATDRASRGVPIAVRLPGGRLDVTIAPDGHATMRGPAAFVFAGVTEI